MWYDGTYVQYSNWTMGRPQMTEDFMAGLTLYGSWEYFTKEHYLKQFKQRSVVACKIERSESTLLAARTCLCLVIVGKGFASVAKSNRDHSVLSLSLDIHLTHSYFVSALMPVF